MSTRRERARIQQQRQQRAQRSRYIAIAAGVAAIVILVALAIFGSGVLNPAAPPPVAVSERSVTCSSVQTFPTQNRDHIQPNQPHPPYSSNPPTSGWHWENAQEWGIYTTPQVQEQLVHNLEHGGIIIQYNNLSTGEVQQLTDLVNRDNYHMILAPYPGLTDARVALTAWNHLQTCTGVDLNAIQAFTGAYRDKGPELVP